MDAYRSYLEGQGLAQTTIKNHIRNLTKYGESFGLNANQDTTLANLLTYAEGSQRQTMTSTISKYRSFMNYENDKIKASVGVSLAKTLELNQATNQSKKDTLPALSFFKKRMNQFFKDEKYKEYVVLYLLINLNVRNMDLVIAKDATDANNHFIIEPKHIVYVRNSYKTFKKYGTKSNKIVDKKFRVAVGQLNGLLTDNDHLTRQIKDITGGYTEADIMKVAVANASSIKKLGKISENRGTALETIKASYDIESD
jgi:hypothetical protein